MKSIRSISISDLAEDHIRCKWVRLPNYGTQPYVDSMEDHIEHILKLHRSRFESEINYPK